MDSYIIRFRWKNKAGLFSKWQNATIHKCCSGVEAQVKLERALSSKKDNFLLLEVESCRVKKVESVIDQFNKIFGFK